MRRDVKLASKGKHMIIQTTENFSEFQVIRNLDYLLRTHSDQVYLISCDYSSEPLLKATNYLADNLISIYGKKILVLDFNEAMTSDFSFYQNLKELSEVKKDDEIDEHKLNIYLEECKKHYEFIFVLPHIKLNIEESKLPALKVDSALILRTSHSIGPHKKKYMTQLIQDAQIKINGIIDLGL